MTQCHVEGKKHPSNGLDLYAGIFNSKLYSSNRSSGGADQYFKWSSKVRTDNYSAYGKSLHAKANNGAFGQADDGYGVTEASDFENGNHCFAVPDHDVQKKYRQNHGLAVRASKANACVVNGAPLSCSANDRMTGGVDFAHPGGSPVHSDGGSRETIECRNSGGETVNVRETKTITGETMKCDTAHTMSDLVREEFVAKEDASACTPKSGELDAYSSNGGIRGQKSGELDAINTNGVTRAHKQCEQGFGWSNSGTRHHKVRELDTISSNGGTVSKDRSNGGTLTSLKGSPNVCNYAGGHGFGDFSSSSGSSNGSSPTSDVAVSGGRLSFVGTMAGNGSSPPSVSSRGVSNISGNLGNLRISGNGSPSNENVSATPATVRAGNGGTRKSGEMMSNGSGNLRGISTAGRISIDGSLGGATGINSGMISKGATRTSPPTKNVSNPATPIVGNLYRGNWNGSMLNGGNLSNGTMCNGGAACKPNIKLTSSNGKVLSYGAVMKSNSKLSEGNRNGTESYRSGTDPEDIKNAGNEYYKRGQFSEALVLYDKAIALCPSNAAYRGNKAAALTGLDRLGEAAQECEEAIRLDPGYNRVHQRLASLYLRFGLVESAKRHFQAAGQQTDLGDLQRLHDIERHISRCIEARKTRDWRNVIRESDAAVVAGADSAPQVFGYKSEALLKLRILEEADEVCTAAQRVESSLIRTAVVPVDAFLLMIRAEIDIVLGRFEGAIQAAESAARIDSRNTEVIALLRKARAVCQSRTSGNECFKAGRFFEACALYGEGLESDPGNAILLCNRAACRSKLGQYEKAVEDCNAALNVQPNYTKALMRRANCSIMLERWEDALRDYEALRREMPSDMEVARALFDVQVAIKKSRGEEIYKMKFGGDVEVVSNNEQFRDAVTSPGLAVVQFNTRWSDHCRQISPFVDQLCKRFPCVNFLKVDVDDNPYLAKTESVSFVPTFKIYKNGQKVKDILGPSQQALEYAVKHYSL